MSAKHCQLGTGMCIRKIKDSTTELINFGSTEHLAGVRLIPGNQYEASMGGYGADSTGGKLAVLINDKYYIPGAFKVASDTFITPLEKNDASGRDVIESTNLEEIFVIVPEDDYQIFTIAFFTGTPGAVVDEQAILGGFQKMADGKIAKLYFMNMGGNFISYNSVTGNGYILSSDTPVTTNFHHQLMGRRKVPWISMRS